MHRHLKYCKPFLKGLHCVSVAQTAPPRFISPSRQIVQRTPQRARSISDRATIGENGIHRTVDVRAFSPPCGNTLRTDQKRYALASCLTGASPGFTSDGAHAGDWDALRNLSRSSMVGRGRSAGLGDAGVPLAVKFSSQMNSIVLKVMFVSLFRWENFNQLVVQELVLAEQFKRVEACRWDYRPQGIGG